jgi:hypothetical protein
VTVYERQALARQSCASRTDRYLCRGDARRGARRLLGRLIPYRCDVCRLWHLRDRA